MTHSPNDIIAEGHFPLEWNGGWRRADIFLTNRANAAFESTFTVSHLHFFLKTTTNYCLSGCWHMVSWVLLWSWLPVSCGWAVFWLAQLVATQNCIEMQINKRLSGNFDCLVLSLHELPFWHFSASCWLCFFFKWEPPLMDTCAKRLSFQQSAWQRGFLSL